MKKREKCAWFLGHIWFVFLGFVLAFSWSFSFRKEEWGERNCVWPAWELQSWSWEAMQKSTLISRECQMKCWFFYCGWRKLNTIFMLPQFLPSLQTKPLPRQNNPLCYCINSSCAVICTAKQKEINPILSTECVARDFIILLPFGTNMQEEKNYSARISNWSVHLKFSSWLPSAIVRFFPHVSPWRHHVVSSAGKMLPWLIPHQIKGIAWSARDGYDSLD